MTRMDLNELQIICYLLMTITVLITASSNITDSVSVLTAKDFGNSLSSLSRRPTAASSLGPLSKSQTNSRPCTVGKSILFTREDVPAGTELLRIPSIPGEVWTLKESGPPGYLSLQDMDEYHQVVFSRIPDIESINRLDGSVRQSMSFILGCTYKGWNYKFRQELIIQDINEQPPIFDTSRPYNISISEDSPVGTIVISLRHLAFDPDITGRVAGYVLQPYSDSMRDGRRFFRISEDGGNIILFQPLDFDILRNEGGISLVLNVTAMDNGSPRPLTAHALFDIQVTDTDDQGPVFWYQDCPMVASVCATPYFQTVTKCGFKGILRLYPGPIRAKDTDSINSSISYSIVRVEPEEFVQHFEIDSETGEVQVMKTSCSASANEVIVTIKATENFFNRRSITTTLQITILDNLIIPRRTWDAPHLIEDVSQRGEHKRSEHNYRSLPLVLFLVSIFGFIAIGGALAFAAVRITKAQRKRNLDSVSKSSLEYSISECGNCSRLGKPDTTVVTAFSACSASSSFGHNSNFFNHNSTDDNNSNPIFSTNLIEPKETREDENVQTLNFTQAKSTILEMQEGKQDRDQDQQRHEKTNQQTKRQNQQHPSLQQANQQQQLHSHPEEEDHQVPFTPNVFSQRRNLFQQQESRHSIGGPMTPLPPLIPLPKSQDQHFKPASLPRPPPEDAWAVLGDTHSTHFNAHSSVPGQTSANGLLSLQRKHRPGSHMQERENSENYLKKTTSFRDHLNQMVPEYLKVTSNGHGYNGNVENKNPVDNADNDNESASGSHPKVRFNLSELSSI